MLLSVCVGLELRRQIVEGGIGGGGFGGDDTPKRTGDGGLRWGLLWFRSGLGDSKPTPSPPRSSHTTLSTCTVHQVNKRNIPKNIEISSFSPLVLFPDPLPFFSIPSLPVHSNSVCNGIVTVRHTLIISFDAPIFRHNV